MRYRTPAALEMAVRDAARHSVVDTGRAIEGFYYHRFLCRVFSDPESKFVLKGGRGVLARTTKARYSRDADFAVVELGIDEAIVEMQRLASLDMDDFISFELRETNVIKGATEYREGVRLVFDTRLGAKKVCPITVDLVSDRIPQEEVERLAPVDRIDVKHVRICDYNVISVPYALADKFCAILEKHADRFSSRVKDLIDILVYIETEEIDERAFALKLRHEARLRRMVLPKHFAIPNEWIEDYPAIYARMIREVVLEDKYPTLLDGSNAAAALFDRSMS